VVAFCSHQIIGGSIRCVPTRATVVSVEYGNTSNPEQQLTVEVRGAAVDCPPNTFEVMTFRNGASRTTVSFTLIVP
jgi:hypothetical protein